MTVCNRCGKENQDHYKFCLGCGAELTAPKPASGGGDMGMMKTMMQEPGQQSPMAGAPLGGGPRGPSSGMPGQPPMGGRSMPGMPPSGPLGAGAMPPPMAPPPMGPPPGVPAYSGFPPPGGAPAMAGGMRRCPSCGSDVPPTFRFCGTCGFRMDEQSAAGPLPSAPSPMAAPMMAPQRSRLSMTLIRPDGTEGGTHDLR